MSKEHKTIDDLMNLVRGMIGTSKVGNPVIGRKGHKAHKKYFRDRGKDKSAARADLIEILLSAREVLSESQYEPFLSWMWEQLSSAFPGGRMQKAIASDMAYILKSHKIPISKEIVWVSSLLLSRREEIDGYLKLKNRISTSIINGNISQALEEISKLEDSFGKSLWAIELQVAIHQARGGISAQKQYVEKIVKESGRGVVSFISHQFSIKNEPGVSLRRFDSDLFEKLGKRKINKDKEVDVDSKEFIKYRLSYSYSFSGESSYSAVLRVVQNYSLIDIYECLIDVVGRLAFSGEEWLGRFAVEVFGKFQGLDDRRINGIINQLGGEFKFGHEAAHLKNHVIGGMIQGGRISSAFQDSMRDLQKNPTSVGSLLILASVISIYSREKSSSYSIGIWGDLIDRLACVIRKGVGAEKASSDLMKICSAFSGVLEFRSLFEWLRFDRDRYASSQLDLHSFYRMALSGIHIPPVVIDRKNGVDAVEFLEIYISVTPYSGHIEAVRAGIKRESAALGKSISACLSRDFGKAAGELDRTESLYAVDVYGALCREIYLVSCSAADYIESAAKLVAELEIESQEIVSYLPLQNLFSDLSHRRFRGMGSSEEVLIFSDVMWRKTFSDHFETARRFLCEEYLRAKSFVRPSLLAGSFSSSIPKKIQYVLRNICIPSVLDMNEDFADQDEVLGERILLCKRLLDCGGRYSIGCADEIESINRSILLRDGFKLVDSNRIYVDVDAISRWAEEYLEEPLARYREYLEVEGDSIVSVDDIFDTFIERQDLSEFTYVPKNEADELLQGMISSVWQKFVGDPKYGLDGFLSKRIRHNTLHGQLRDHLESLRLVTHIDTSGRYKRNDYWADSLKNSSVHDRQKVADALEEFSKQFDLCVRRVASEVLQIKSDSFPKGLIDVSIGQSSYFFVRANLKDDASVRSLCSSSAGIFWATLEKSLSQVRSYLTGKFLEQLKAIFSGLASKIEKIQRESAAEYDQGFGELRQAIGLSMGRLETEVAHVAGWFVQAKAQALSTPVDAGGLIATSLDMAKSVHSAVKFTGPLSTAVTGQYQYGAALVLYDIFYIVVDNAYRHSDHEGLVKLSIDIENSSEPGILNMTFSNFLPHSKRSRSDIKKLEVINGQVRRQEFDAAVRREGSSGLLKIASIVSSRPGGSIDFGISGDEFRLSIRLPETTFLVA